MESATAMSAQHGRPVLRQKPSDDGTEPKAVTARVVLKNAFAIQFPSGCDLWKCEPKGQNKSDYFEGANMERKLAAILATDIVGFAGLVSRDESSTLARLERLEREVVRMQVEANRGRVFKSTGDGFLAEFSSIFEAVNCAVGIQRASAFEARQSKTDDVFVLRIGVSLGDVVVQGSDLLGDGVNTAARLEAMAEPGGIAVSGEVMAQIRGN